MFWKCPRPADYIIGPKDDPQVLRWWVIPRNRWFNIYLHKFCRSDDDRALHDHPWHNMSIVLKGEYLEIMPKTGVQLFHAPNALKAILRRPFRPIIRRAKSPHRVLLLGEPNPAPCWSLFITGPVLRIWGFHCSHGWIAWQQFVERYEGGNSRGKGCD